MLGELPQDIIGTDPKYLPIVNLDYLSVDPKTYDNYPSDNNSVRIQPKLGDLWNHNKQTGLNLVPNQTVQTLGLKSAEEKTVDDIICEAKKAMMTGLKGSALADHLRARFTTDHLVSAKEAMEKLSEEQGLLGNVYIDASAFANAREAEQFLTMHRNRLAQDIVINESQVNPTVVSFLANKFHKNVVAEIIYDENLFGKYRAHLVDAGYIDRDYVIDSKEALRKAFMAERVRERPIVTAKTKKRISKEEAVQEIINRAENQELSHRLATEDMLFRNIYPILEFTRQNFVKGKTGEDLKGMLRGKYASNDLRDAAKYIAVVISDKVTPGGIDKLVKLNKISERIGDELKKLAKEYPLKIKAFEEKETTKPPVGVQGHLHVLSGKSDTRPEEQVECHEASVELLRRGKSLEEVKGFLMKKVSSEESDKILLDAIKDFNKVSAGVKANVVVKAPKKKLVADLKEKKTLPDPETIVPQTQEFLDFYKGAEFNIEIDEAPSTEPLQINDLGSTSGLDTVL